jgi:hypothetical protein
MKQEVGLRRKHRKVHSERSDHSERSEGRGGGGVASAMERYWSRLIATDRDSRWRGR